MSINRAAVSSAWTDLCTARPAAAIPSFPFGDSCTTRDQGARPHRHSCESRNPGRPFEVALDSRFRGNDGQGWPAACQTAASSHIGDSCATRGQGARPLRHSCESRNLRRPFEWALDSRFRGNDGQRWMAACQTAASSHIGDSCATRGQGARPFRHSCESRNLRRPFEVALDSRFRGNDGQVWLAACQTAASSHIGDSCATRGQGARPFHHSCESRNLSRSVEWALDSRFRGNDGQGWMAACQTAASSHIGDSCATRGQGARPLRHSCESRNLRRPFEWALDSRFRGNDGQGWLAASQAAASFPLGDFCATRGHGARPLRHSCESRNLRRSFEAALDSRFRGNDGSGRGREKTFTPTQPSTGRTAWN